MRSSDPQCFTIDGRKAWSLGIGESLDDGLWFLCWGVGATAPLIIK